MQIPFGQPLTKRAGAEKKLKVEERMVAQEESHPAGNCPILFFIVFRPPGWRYCPSRINIYPITSEDGLRCDLKGLTEISGWQGPILGIPVFYT